MRSAPTKTGACLDLPLSVVDKYFAADGNRDMFAFQTAKAICRNCAILDTCLADAITASPSQRGTHGVRAGESGSSLDDLHREWLASPSDLDALVLTAIGQQLAARTIGQSTTLRAGRFPDMTLIETEG